MEKQEIVNNQVVQENWFKKHKNQILIGCGIAITIVGGIFVYKNRSVFKAAFLKMSSAGGKKAVQKVTKAALSVEKAPVIGVVSEVAPIVQVVADSAKVLKSIPEDLVLTGNKLTATQLGRKMYCSGKAINKMLIACGLAVRDISGELEMTELGKAFGETTWKTTKYEHNFTNIIWDEAVLSLLFSKEEIEEAALKHALAEEILSKFSA